ISGDMPKWGAACAKLPASTTRLKTAMLRSRSIVSLRNAASERPKRNGDYREVSASPIAVSRVLDWHASNMQEVIMGIAGAVLYSLVLVTVRAMAPLPSHAKHALRRVWQLILEGAVHYGASLHAVQRPNSKR